jgi:hypothetical protein
MGIAKRLMLLRRSETAPAPLAYSGLVFPCIRAAGFMADNVIDNGHVTGFTGYGSVFRHRFI